MRKYFAHVLARHGGAATRALIWCAHENPSVFDAPTGGPLRALVPLHDGTRDHGDERRTANSV
jgi:hypothetical protein